VWSWARTHLRRTGRSAPELMAWHWTPEGQVDDWDVATDADVDMAAALLLAADRWHRPARAGLPPYGEAARAILRDLIAHTRVTDADGRPFLLPGLWADERATDAGLVLNPSYLAPAWYRVFAAATNDRRWTALADASYDLLDAVCQPARGHVAIPDWVRWHAASRWAAAPRGDVVSGWDAVRVPWRVASDARWFGSPRARRLLRDCLTPFVRARAAEGLAVEHHQDGRVAGAPDHPLANALLSLAAPNNAVRDQLLARVEARLIRQPRGTYFGEPDRYYVNSLAYLPFLTRAGRDTRPRP
jgi:endoglucanase